MVAPVSELGCPACGAALGPYELLCPSCGARLRHVLPVENLELHAPSLDDVFLTKTGRTLEGAAEEEETAA